MWERYWTRKTWEIELDIVTNPLAGGSEEPGRDDSVDIDLSEGLNNVDALAAMGLPVKKLEA